MKRPLQILILTVLGVCSIKIQGQNELDLFKNMSMRSIGPAVTSGRVTAIDVHPNNPNIIITGTASGGVWKSESGGVNWQPVFDYHPIDDKRSTNPPDVKGASNYVHAALSEALAGKPATVDIDLTLWL